MWYREEAMELFWEITTEVLLKDGVEQIDDES